jgi:hypothetical protein
MKCNVNEFNNLKDTRANESRDTVLRTLQKQYTIKKIIFSKELLYTTKPSSGTFGEIQQIKLTK